MKKRNGEVKVTFGLVTGPDREGWPIHGEFLLRRTGMSNVHGSPIFSTAVLQTTINQMINGGLIDQERALAIRSMTDDLGLPSQATRYDALVATALRYCAEAEDARPLYHRFIDVICGAVPPEKGSGEARFEICRNGKFCSAPHCHHYPRHGAIFYSRFGRDLTSKTIFAPETVRRYCDKSLNQGLLTQEEANALKDFGSGILIADERTARADKIILYFSGSTMYALLDVVFGYMEYYTPPSFVKCRAHYHLSIPIVDELNRRTKLITMLYCLPNQTIDSISTSLHNRDEVRRHIQRMLAIGVLSPDEAINLRSDAAPFFSGAGREATTERRDLTHSSTDTNKQARR
ncbi:MAG: hypothetical protein PHS79_01080 [Patescibacteria group bacterium]|nr:hypothetical protein [Patescibacteria group bacterium]